jgi:hypothetical protein
MVLRRHHNQARDKTVKAGYGKADQGRCSAKLLQSTMGPSMFWGQTGKR